MIKQDEIELEFFEITNSIIDFFTQRYAVGVRPTVNQRTNAVKFIVTSWPKENGAFLVLQREKVRSKFEKIFSRNRLVASP